MPYIKVADRQLYTNALLALTAQIKNRGKGTLKHTCAAVISELISRSYANTLRYKDYNEIIGMLTCCYREWQRRYYQDTFVAGDYTYLTDPISTTIPGIENGTINSITCMVLSLGSGARAGHLNYIITRMLIMVFGNPNTLPDYEHEGIIGLLESVASVWYIESAGPYEDLKIKENGDVL